MNLRRGGTPILGGVFFTGVVLAVLLWDHIFLPFHNPLQVVGYCTKIQINPQNDLIRFALFVLLPPALLVLLDRFGGKGFRDRAFSPGGDVPSIESKAPLPARPWWITPLLAAYGILLALNVPTYHAFGRFDSYHEGESLGTAICYLAGEKPYHDFFFFHGLIQDPLRSAWAFQLFGKSIAAERTFESLAKLLSWICLTFFLDELFRKKASLVALFLSLFALGYVSFSFLAFDTFLLPQLSPAAVVDQFQKHRSFWEMFNLLIITPRALATYLFLLVFLKLKKVFSSDGEGKGTGFWALTFLFSFVPLAALGYSVDRGLYVAILYAFLFPLFYVLYVRFHPWKGKWFLGSALGVGAAFLLLEGLSQGNLWEGLKFIFLMAPAYKGLSETMPVPLFQWKFLFFFTLMAAMAYRFVCLALAGKNSAGGRPWIAAFLKRNLVEGALLALAGLHFLNVLVRGDEEHLVYSLSVLYTLVFYVLARLTRRITLAFNPAAKRACVALVLVVSFFCLARDFRADVLQANFPLGTSDETFISKNDQATIRLLRETMGPSDGFFTMTSEASWYYFLNKPCPTRFPYIWIAAPKLLQEEVVRDLAAKKVKWVLYKDDDWSDWIDGISNAEKFPVVSRFIRDHYRPFKNVGGNDIWVLKPATPH